MNRLANGHTNGKLRYSAADWIGPQHGDRGGTFWQSRITGEKVYQADNPGGAEPAQQQQSQPQQPQQPDIKATAQKYAQQARDKWGDQAHEKLTAIAAKLTADSSPDAQRKLVAVKAMLAEVQPAAPQAQPAKITDLREYTLPPMLSWAVHDFADVELDEGDDDPAYLEAYAAAQKAANDPKNKPKANARLGEYPKMTISMSPDAWAAMVDEFDRAAESEVYADNDDDERKLAAQKRKIEKETEKLVDTLGIGRYGQLHKKPKTQPEQPKAIETKPIATPFKAGKKEKPSPDEALSRVQKLYDSALDNDRVFEDADALMADLGKTMSVAQLKELAGKFDIGNPGKSKDDVLGAIGRKIKGRREFSDRTKIEANPVMGEEESKSHADRIDAVYDSSALKMREKADKWNAKFSGATTPDHRKQAADAIRGAIDDYGEARLPEAFRSSKLDKMAFMRAVNAMVKDGELKLEPDTGSLLNWEKNGGDADLAFVDPAGAPMDIVKIRSTPGEQIQASADYDGNEPLRYSAIDLDELRRMPGPEASAYAKGILAMIQSRPYLRKEFKLEDIAYLEMIARDVDRYAADEQVFRDDYDPAELC